MIIWLLFENSGRKKKKEEIIYWFFPHEIPDIKLIMLVNTHIIR